MRINTSRNTQVFTGSSSFGGLAEEQADLRYVKLNGDQTVEGELTFTGGIRTNDIAPLNGSSTVKMNGDLDFTGALYQDGEVFTSGTTITSDTDLTIRNLSAVGITCDNLTATGEIAGTLWTSAQPLITRVGTLTNLSVASPIVCQNATQPDHAVTKAQLDSGLTTKQNVITSSTNLTAGSLNATALSVGGEPVVLQNDLLGYQPKLSSFSHIEVREILAQDIHAGNSITIGEEQVATVDYVDQTTGATQDVITNTTSLSMLDLTVGGNAQINGLANVSNGIIINSGNLVVTNGVNSLTITPTSIAANTDISITSNSVFPPQEGQAGKFLTTNGSNVSWGTVTGGGGGTPGGVNGQLQFNDGGAFGGDSDLTWNKDQNALTLSNGSVNLAGGTGLSTVLLLHFDQTPIVDNGIHNLTFTTVASPSISSTQSRFGGSSVNFNTSGAYNVASFPTIIGTNDFTFECWLYPTAVPGVEGSLIDCNGGNLLITLDSNGGNVRTRVWIAVSALFLNFSIPWSSRLNTWNHFAVCRQNGVVRGFFNGVVSTNTTTQNGFINSTNLGVGKQNYANAFVGFVDEMRLLNGISQYTTPFVPPTTPFANSTVGGLNFSGYLLNNGTIFPNYVNTSAMTTAGTFLPTFVSNATGLSIVVTNPAVSFTQATSTLTATNLVVTNNLTVDTNTLRVDPVNNRVGINVLNPVVDLELFGIFRNTNNRVDLAWYNNGRHIEVNASSPNQSFIDFHSNDNQFVDYDTRISSNGGVAGQVGQGTMRLEAEVYQLTGSSITYDTKTTGTVRRSFPVQYHVFSGSVNPGPATVISLTSAFRGRYNLHIANRNGDSYFCDAFCFGALNNTRSQWQVNPMGTSGAGVNATFSSSASDTTFSINLNNSSASQAFYHIMVWVGGF